MTHQERIKLTWLVNIAVVCLALGIMLPVMRINVDDGTIRGFIMAFITPGPSSYSILSSVWVLLSKGVVMDILLACIIFLFSVVFPFLKLGVFYHKLNDGTVNKRISALVHRWGRFSMLDVYIVAILILTIRTLPGDAQIRPSWGILLFTISVMLSLYISSRLDA